jgi:hypothetical protein
MATTYEKIATTTLGSTSATITLSSIPATYTDLRIVLVAKGTAYLEPYFYFNGDTASNYSKTQLYGEGTNALSIRATSANNIFWHYYGTPGSTNPGFYDINVMSYAGSTFKTAIGTANEDDNGSGSVSAIVGLYRSTSAITSITFGTNANSYAAGTIVTIYGILKA